MQIVKYKTISMRMTDAFDLEKQSPLETKFDFIINSWVESGWQPFGQPYFILDQKWQQINQTMVKYDRDKVVGRQGYADTDFSKYQTVGQFKDMPDDISE